jgi:hypothetical protein
MNKEMFFKVNDTSIKGNYGQVEMSYASTLFRARGSLLQQLQQNSVNFN